MTVRLSVITALIVLFIVTPLFAQSGYEQRRAEIQERRELARQEIESLENQIQSYRERLELATQRYDEMYRQYEELTRMVTLQDEKIRRLQDEQRETLTEIEMIEETLQELEQELVQLIEQYKETLTYLYKHGRTNELALIFTSTSINQLIIRSHYLKRFDDHRNEQASQIREKQDRFEQMKTDLQETREHNEEILVEIQQEKNELARKENQQKRNIELLQRDRDNLRNQLSVVQEQLSQLDETLTRLANEEEALRRAEEERQQRLAAAMEIEDDAEREAAIERYSRAAPRVGMVSEDELRAFESTFADAKGEMPWPVEDGTITEKFGVKVHPVFRTRTSNPGVDIAAPPRSRVRVVHDGYVYAIQPLPGFGDVLLVSHGNFKTVYGNLSDIFVTRGSVLRKGDIIGLSGDENSIRGEALFFMIRDGNQDVDPELWIQNQTP